MDTILPLKNVLILYWITNAFFWKCELCIDRNLTNLQTYDKFSQNRICSSFILLTSLITQIENIYMEDTEYIIKGTSLSSHIVINFCFASKDIKMVV